MDGQITFSIAQYLIYNLISFLFICCCVSYVHLTFLICFMAFSKRNPNQSSLWFFFIAGFDIERHPIPIIQLNSKINQMNKEIALPYSSLIETFENLATKLNKIKPNGSELFLYDFVRSTDSFCLICVKISFTEEKLRDL